MDQIGSSLFDNKNVKYLFNLISYLNSIMVRFLLELHHKHSVLYLTLVLLTFGFLLLIVPPSHVFFIIVSILKNRQLSRRMVPNLKFIMVPVVWKALSVM